MAILGLAGAGAAVAILAFSAAGSPLSKRIQTIFASHQPEGGPVSASVSEADKNLARDYYLKGRYEWNQRTPNSLNRALDLFTQAIVHDPAYAQPYAGLADTYDLLWEYSTLPANQAFPRAIAAARKAVELDDSLSEAHRALAFAEMYGSWNFDGAEKEFRRAIELDPKDAQARRWYANAFAVPGRYEESLHQINKAQELDPTSHATLADKGILLANAGRTQEAIDLLREVERSAPEFRSPHYYLMEISLEYRDYPTFLSEGEKAAESSNDPVLKDVTAAARSGYQRGGSRGLLNGLYARQREYYRAGKFNGSILAKTCVLMGRKQEALQLLEDAYAHHEIDVLSCLSHPDLLTLRDEPRYKALVEKFHFPMRPAVAPPVDSQGNDCPRLAFAARY
jgi:Flp pilus assembly protein TadD